MRERRIAAVAVVVGVLMGVGVAGIPRQRSEAPLHIRPVTTTTTTVAPPPPPPPTTAASTTTTRRRSR